MKQFSDCPKKMSFLAVLGYFGSILYCGNNPRALASYFVIFCNIFLLKISASGCGTTPILTFRTLLCISFWSIAFLVFRALISRPISSAFTVRKDHPSVSGIFLPYF